MAFDPEDQLRAAYHLWVPETQNFEKAAGQYQREEKSTIIEALHENCDDVVPFRAVVLRRCDDMEPWKDLLKSLVKIGKQACGKEVSARILEHQSLQKQQIQVWLQGSAIRKGV